MTFEEELVGLRPNLFRWAVRLTYDVDRAQDLLQDTMVKALANKHSFQPGSNMSAWAFTIMRNEFFTAARRKQLFVEDPYGTYTEKMIIEAPQEPREDFRDVWSALQRLPQKQQDALNLVGVLGHSYEEAAEILHVPIGTIKSQVSRAREALTCGYN